MAGINLYLKNPEQHMRLLNFFKKILFFFLFCSVCCCCYCKPLKWQGFAYDIMNVCFLSLFLYQFQNTRTNQRTNEPHTEHKRKLCWMINISYWCCIWCRLFWLFFVCFFFFFCFSGIHTSALPFAKFSLFINCFEMWKCFH